MTFLTYLAITSILCFDETKGEELLLSALKRDIEENVMEGGGVIFLLLTQGVINIL